MKINYYSIKDNVVGHFGGLVVGDNDEAIKRQVWYQLLNKDSIYSKKPSDFDLYKIGIFDDVRKQSDGVGTEL